MKYKAKGNKTTTKRTPEEYVSGVSKKVQNKRAKYWNGLGYDVDDDTDLFIKQKLVSGQVVEYPVAHLTKDNEVKIGIITRGGGIIASHPLKGSNIDWNSQQKPYKKK